MKIEIDKRLEGVVIKLKGNIIGIPDATEFNRAIKELIDENKKNIVVDFGDVSYVNSTGLGIIVRGYQSIKAVGGDIKIASVNVKMQSLLEITKLNTIFDVYSSANDALTSYK